MITATTTTTEAAAVNDKTIIQIAKPYTELLFKESNYFVNWIENPKGRVNGVFSGMTALEKHRGFCCCFYRAASVSTRIYPEIKLFLSL